MFEDSYPKFISKHMLKTEQSDLLRDFPREMAALEYAGYADGVLFGCRMNASDKINVEPGVILKGGIFYRMTRPAGLSYEPNDATQYVNVRFTNDEVSKEDIALRVAEIVLEYAPADKDGMELARFKLKRGSRLRSDYVDFEDLDTEFDTLRLTHAPCAGRGGATLLPFITELFAKEALSHHPSDSGDIQFALLCLQESRVQLPVLQGYLDKETRNLRELYLGLLEKLSVIKSNGRKAVLEERHIHKILVD